MESPNTSAHEHQKNAIPPALDEAVRDVCRARTDASDDLSRANQRLRPLTRVNTLGWDQCGREFIEHIHRERNHQGLDNRLLAGEPPSANPNTAVRRRGRIGDLLNFYYREAA